MTTLKYLLAAGAVALPCVLSAQPTPAPAPPKDTVFYVANGAAVMPFRGQVDVLRGEGSVIGGVVKDKPYSASSITESTQILADGNRIVSRNESKIYRDSQGRTRLEQTLGGLGVWQTANEPLTMVTINDPVAGVTYFVDAVSRTARKLQPFRLALSELEGQALEGVDGKWTQAVPAPLPLPPGVPGAIGGERVVVANGAVAQRVFVQRRAEPNATEPPATFEVAVPPPGPGVAIGGVAVAGAPAAGVAVRTFGPATMVAGSFGFPGAQVADENLGDQVLEGVLAHGTRQTQTIPAGTIGNERAIDIVSEQWYSDEIEAVVLRRNVDPRFGETSYRLVSVVRGEPSPDAFTVPQDFDVQSEPSVTPRVELHRVEPGPEASAEASGPRAERRVFLVQPGSAPK